MKTTTEYEYAIRVEEIANQLIDDFRVSLASDPELCERVVDLFKRETLARQEVEDKPVKSNPARDIEVAEHLEAMAAKFRKRATDATQPE